MDNERARRIYWEEKYRKEQQEHDKTKAKHKVATMWSIIWGVWAVFMALGIIAWWLNG